MTGTGCIFLMIDLSWPHRSFHGNATESPYHAVGLALMAYVEAMLGFETDKSNLLWKKSLRQKV